MVLLCYIVGQATCELANAGNGKVLVELLDGAGLARSGRSAEVVAQILGLGTFILG